MPKNSFLHRLPAILAAATWVNISEFLRNEWLLKSVWVDGFQSIGLHFPDRPVNGALWGLWAIIFAVVLSILCTRFTIWQSTVLAWVPGFLLVWLAMGNMGVLPPGLLYWAIPWSFVEVLIAAAIIHHMTARLCPRA